MHSEHTKEPLEEKGYTRKDVLYREGAVGLFDVQRAADALLRLGIKPSVAAIRNQIGGGSPNTITPLLAKYWENLGSRLVEGPESLERVPEALARVTELLWRRALEEARARLRVSEAPSFPKSTMEELQAQIGKLSVALAEAGAREGEQLTHLSMLSTEREALRAERGSLVGLLKSAQTLLQQQNSRVAVLERARIKKLSPRRRTSSRHRGPTTESVHHKPTQISSGHKTLSIARKRARRPK
jgi:hypothetical protein